MYYLFSCFIIEWTRCNIYLNINSHTFRESNKYPVVGSFLQGDLFGGLNSGLQDGLLSRAEALAEGLGKHNGGTPMPLKHDPVSVYHHGAHMPTPHPNNRPHHQVQSHLFVSLNWYPSYYCRLVCYLYILDYNHLQSEKQGQNNGLPKYCHIWAIHSKWSPKIENYKSTSI